MSSRELTEWMVFDKFYPIGRERDDWRGAQISAILAEIYRDQAKRQEPYTTGDFMPAWGDQDREDQEIVDIEHMSPEGRVFWLEMLNATYGGIDKRHG